MLEKGLVYICDQSLQHFVRSVLTSSEFGCTRDTYKYLCPGYSHVGIPT